MRIDSRVKDEACASEHIVYSNWKFKMQNSSKHQHRWIASMNGLFRSFVKYCTYSLLKVIETANNGIKATLNVALRNRQRIWSLNSL